MRRIIVGVTAIATAAAWSAPALSKAHLMPSDRADQLGQANASAVTRDDSGMITGLDPTGARNVDARQPQLLGSGTRGVDGKTFSDLRSASGGSERGMKAGEMTKPR